MDDGQQGEAFRGQVRALIFLSLLAGPARTYVAVPF